ncbi:MAG: phosphate acyltransferase PlsX [Gammaproteobacteria bacterium]|nr:phosphate acyltransferase PlsX [Gammaproteobacteria bacterium]
MTPSHTIALDAMSGDLGPDVVIQAAIDVLARNKSVKLILVGDEQQLSQKLQDFNAEQNERLTIHHASQVVEMHESPSLAMRKKKDSSMRVSINLVDEGAADACVSAGNTGALMATSRFVLKTLSGIDRPAIISALPSIEGHTHVLDLGANVDCSSEHLFQFAVMGSVLASAIDNIEHPRVGLLNVGEEEIKGNERVKLASQLLSDSDLNYIGFVEGDDIYKGGVDVVVCDGFVGNVALKTSEGLAKMISHFMKEEFSRNILTRIMGLITIPVLRAFRKKFDPRRYNGASLVGLRGIVIKSHGGADKLAFANAIEIAMIEVDKAVPQKISSQLESILMEKQVS